MVARFCSRSVKSSISVCHCWRLRSTAYQVRSTGPWWSARSRCRSPTVRWSPRHRCPQVERRSRSAVSAEVRQDACGGGRSRMRRTGATGPRRSRTLYGALEDACQRRHAEGSLAFVAADALGCPGVAACGGRDVSSRRFTVGVQPVGALPAAGVGPVWTMRAEPRHDRRSRTAAVLWQLRGDARTGPVGQRRRWSAARPLQGWRVERVRVVPRLQRADQRQGRSSRIPLRKARRSAPRDAGHGSRPGRTRREPPEDRSANVSAVT